VTKKQLLSLLNNIKAINEFYEIKPQPKYDQNSIKNDGTITINKLIIDKSYLHLKIDKDSLSIVIQVI
jgi:hypothetical protein